MDEMRNHLVDVCKALRVGDDPRKPLRSRTQVAAHINQGEQTIARFEQQVGEWHKRTGDVVAAYAKVSGVEPIDLWRAAIELWESAEKDSARSSEHQPSGQGTPPQGHNLDKTMKALQETAAARRAAQSARRKGR